MKRLAPGEHERIPHPFERIPENPAPTLPKELLQNIVCHLDFTSKVSASMVNRFFNQAAFYERKDAVFANFFPFLDRLLNNLDSCPEQKAEISSIIDEIRGAGKFPVSLLIESREMKDLFPNYKERVIAVFKTLAPEGLNGMIDFFADQPQPYFFYELKLLSEKYNSKELLLKINGKNQEKIKELLDSGAVVTKEVLFAALAHKLPLKTLAALFESSPFAKHSSHFGSDLSAFLDRALQMKVDLAFVKALINAGALPTEACFRRAVLDPISTQFLLDTGVIPPTNVLNFALNRKQATEETVKALLNAGTVPCSLTLNSVIEYKYSTELTLRVIEALVSRKWIPSHYDALAAFFCSDYQQVLSALVAAGLIVTDDLLHMAKLMRISPETLTALKEAYIEQNASSDKE